ncbi:hypothetical protein MJ8_37210 [Mesorhizobium sp. J8]|nr:hypothetical protein [Mesorhizobium sp. J8]BCM19938.1 hypothetical protein MJ8_37210 [Mesorhizobium sp. J8]
MIRKSSASLAAVAILASVSGTAAGGRALECYEPIHRPALYDTVYEDVMLSPGGQVVDYDAPIYGTSQSVDQIAPPRVTYETVPAVTRTVSTIRSRSTMAAMPGSGASFMAARCCARYGARPAMRVSPKRS